MQSYSINSQKRKLQVIIVAFIIITMLSQWFIPLVVRAADSNIRTIDAHIRGSYTVDDVVTQYDKYVKVSGSGFFKIITCAYSSSYGQDSDAQKNYQVYVLSDKPFTYMFDYQATYSNANQYSASPSIYGVTFSFMFVENDNSHLDSIEATNIMHFASYNEFNTYRENHIIKDAITKDDYKELVFDDSTTVSTDDLSLASLGSYTKSACTLSKTDSGWNFVMPSEAGVDVNWTYKKHIDGSFMRLTYKGKFRKSILDVSYVDKQIVIGGEGIDATVVIDNIDCSNTDYFISYQDLLAKCKEQNNFDKGYNFEIENIYVQRFAKIGDNLCRSRLYRVGMEMRTDISTDGSASDTITLKPTTAVKGTTDSSSDNFVGDTDQSDFVTDIVADKPITDIDFSDGDNTFLQQFLWFYNCLQSLKKSIGQFPALIAEVFSFLPSQFILFIGLAISAVIVLRLIGR